MATYCGLDFGTTNSSVCVKSNNIQLIELENSKKYIPSAVFIDSESSKWIFGNPAIQEYINGVDGRFMASLKSILGSPLMKDKTLVNKRLMTYESILGKFISYLKHTSEQAIQRSLDNVVLGRPVRFNVKDEESDKIAENTLREIAINQGFKQVEFLYEPVAASHTYKQLLTKEEIVLIVDIGGGSSDFSIVKLTPGYNQTAKDEILANKGIFIAGNNFDKALNVSLVMPQFGMGSMITSMEKILPFPTHYFHDISTWHLINTLYTSKIYSDIDSLWRLSLEKERTQRLVYTIKHKKGHALLHVVENEKKRLSDKQSACIDLSFIEESLAIAATRKQLNDALQYHVDTILKTIDETIREAMVNVDNVNTVFFTGGSCNIPLIQDSVMSTFNCSRTVKGDTFGSVGIGLAIEAERIFS